MRNRLLPLLLLLCLPGCDSADNPVAPTGSSLAVSANPTKISLTGSSEITVTGFRPDGNVLSPGTQIRLSTDVGRIEAPIIEVGAGGVATGRLVAEGTAGMAMVSANLTTGAADAAATATVEISELKPTVELRANPPTIGTGEVSEITVISRDENQFPFSAQVELIASFGTLRLNGREVTSIQTASNGRGVVDFVAGDDTGDGSVTGFVANSDSTENSTVSITIETEPTGLTISPEEPTLSPGGGTITFTATLIDAEGRGVRDRLVEFDTTLSSNLGRLDISSDFTDASGQSMTTLTVDGSGALPATFEVSALSGGFRVAAVVTVSAGGS